MAWKALSIACMPEAQLRCTVQAVTRSPQPSRSAAIRAGLASPASGATQPRMTSSSASAANG
jgi:hypothetical protein